VLSIINIEICR